MSDSSTPKTAKLTIGDREIDLPVLQGTEGELAVDIRRLRSETGVITYDPGLGNTGSCQSEITFLDGEQGRAPLSRATPSSNFAENTAISSKSATC